MKESMVPKQVVKTYAAGDVHKYKGIGGKQINVLFKIKCILEFSNKKMKSN